LVRENFNTVFAETFDRLNNSSGACVCVCACVCVRACVCALEVMGRIGMWVDGVIVRLNKLVVQLYLEKHMWCCYKSFE
jgi:hypothetical protein